MNNSTLTVLCVKLFGVVFILSSLLDYLTLLIPLNFKDPQWQLGLVTSLVDRGIVPMVGVAMIMVGYWIESVINANNPKNSSSGFDLRLPTFVLSAILGLMFLLIVPIHLNNLNQAKSEALTQIEKGASQGKEQIQGFLRQVNSLSQNPEILNQQIEQRSKVIERVDSSREILLLLNNCSLSRMKKLNCRDCAIYQKIPPPIKARLLKSKNNWKLNYKSVNPKQKGRLPPRQLSRDYARV